MESYIETVSGRKFYFLDPQPEDIDIEDIAHALAMNCRYTGHCRIFYSVAEHSWHMSRMAPEEQQLACLLHDASEAYITDIASPIKQHLPDYREMETRLEKAIFEKFGLDYPMHPLVKFYDLTMLSTEAHYLLPSHGNTWDMWKAMKRPTVQTNFKPIGMEPRLAKQVFLDRFEELSKQHELKLS